MALTREVEQHLEVVAVETLSAFEGVADVARKKIENSQQTSCNVVSQNTWNSTAANEQISRIGATVRESYRTLVSEPAIARVVAVDEQKKQKVYYICRATPASGLDILLASYNSPAGRLASLPVGDELELPNGTLLEVVEKAKLSPIRVNGEWDSKDSTLEAGSFGPITVKSMRALVSKVEIERHKGEGFDEALLNRLLAEERDESNVIDGLKRSVIEKMGLRDQPILDQYQDEIFRLPLNRKLIIMGPPGTGKTTTLIRRLGQKCDVEFLEDDEKSLVRQSAHANRKPHEQSWIMFTPTELLKLYLKEAFAREGVPASDRHIRTWSDFRREFGRVVFRILRTSNGGTYILKDNDEILLGSTVVDMIKWCDDFDHWQKESFNNELKMAAHQLSREGDTVTSNIGKFLLAILDKHGTSNMADMFVALANLADDVKAIESKLKVDTNSKITGAINVQVNRDHRLLDKLSDFLDTVQQLESIQDDADEDESDEEEPASLGTRSNAVNTYKQALRAQARAFATKKKVGSKTKSGQVLDWVGNRALSEIECDEVGAKLVTLTHIRKFKDPLKRYLYGIQVRYKSYRRQRQSESMWYKSTEFHVNDLHPLELDIIIFSILSGAERMLKKRSVLRDIDENQWSSLRPIHELSMNQVFVDEATDFSPIQLACMAKLSHPDTQSFFACGDFNQRLTVWGAKNLHDFSWVLADASVKEVNISYRQSRQLNDLAVSIIQAVSGEGYYARPSLPDHVDSEGVSPVLIENAVSLEVISTWLANRIGEVERMVQKLPSIAVFVDDELNVQPLADALNVVLQDSNIQAVACQNGQVMGNNNDVRVFDIQHIKGLEFEAVFFVGIDRLATSLPDLFDKYLYVGATRAATYLGISCERELPREISSLRSHFGDDWSC